MTLQTIEIDEVRIGRSGGRTKGEKYKKYGIAIEKCIPWIREEIEKSKDDTVRVRNSDIRKEMGGEFVNKNETSIYWGLKYILFQEGIVVETGTHKSGDKLLMMRLANDDDKLPESLAKYLEPAEVDEDTTPETIKTTEVDENIDKD